MLPALCGKFSTEAADHTMVWSAVLASWPAGWLASHAACMPCRHAAQILTCHDYSFASCNSSAPLAAFQGLGASQIQWHKREDTCTRLRQPAQSAPVVALGGKKTGRWGSRSPAQGCGLGSQLGVRGATCGGCVQCNHAAAATPTLLLLAAATAAAARGVRGAHASLRARLRLWLRCAPPHATTRGEGVLRLCPHRRSLGGWVEEWGVFFLWGGGGIGRAAAAAGPSTPAPAPPAGQPAAQGRLASQQSYCRRAGQRPRLPPSPGRARRSPM